MMAFLVLIFVGVELIVFELSEEVTVELYLNPTFECLSL
tara:strand:- start:34 stop:150 length:117 start_codon:yes stop_codon:yes gene_type:complete